MTTEGEVCTLTGLVVRPPAELHHWARDRDGRRALQTHMGPARARNSKLQSRAGRVAEFALVAVKRLLAGEARRRDRQTQLTRVTKAAARGLKAGHGFKQLHAAVAVMAIRAGGALRPCCREDDPTLVTLATRIATYAVTMGVAGQRRAVYAFVAAAVQFLASGYTVSGTTVIPRLAFVAAHAPAELQHGPLLGIQCRAVSAASRLIVDRCVGQGGFADPRFVFPFTPWRPRARAETATPTPPGRSPASPTAPPPRS